MGTGERSIAPAKRSKIPTSAAPPANPPPSPPPVHSDRPISVQALYSGAATAASAALPVFYSPLVVSSTYPGGSQYPYPSYGIPIAYAPMFPYGGIYAQPALATGSVYIAAEAERRLAEKKSKEEESSWNGGDGMKATSDSVNENGSQSSDIEGEGSSSTGLQDYSSTEKKNIGETLRDGGSMQHIGSTQYDNTTAESSSSGKGPATKLSVSASGREALHGPTSISTAESLSVIAEQKGLLPEHHCLLDERELKKQRRKQSNREAARRSRLRKQQDYEDLARRVDVLKSENNALRMEIEQLARENKELDSENASIAENLNKIFSRTHQQ